MFKNWHRSPASLDVIAGTATGLFAHGLWRVQLYFPSTTLLFCS